MTGIVTPFQNFRENDFADINKCVTLEHFIVPSGRSSSLIDYKTGLRYADAFTGHDVSEKYSIPAAVSPGTAITEGSWVDLSTNNFAALVVGFWDNSILTVQYGDSTTNGNLAWSATGGIKGDGGTASLAVAPNDPDTVNGRTLIRSAADSTRLEIDGAVIDSDNSTDVGEVTLDDDIGLLFLDQFYGSVIFKFAGNLPDDFDAVLAVLISDLKNGIYRVSKAVEDWT